MERGEKSPYQVVKRNAWLSGRVRGHAQPITDIIIWYVHLQ